MIRQKPKVDAVVTQWATGALFAEVFDCPVVLFSPNGPFLTEGTNLLINRNLQPLLWAPFIEPMSLMQQLVNNFIGYIICKAPENNQDEERKGSMAPAASKFTFENTSYSFDEVM